MPCSNKIILKVTQMIPFEFRRNDFKNYFYFTTVNEHFVISGTSKRKFDNKTFYKNEFFKYVFRVNEMYIEKCKYP